MANKKILENIAAAFLGFLLGRIGDNYINIWMGDPLWLPHHWIYGLILVIIGLHYRKKRMGLALLFFGIGIFISDFNDFTNLKFFAEDFKNGDMIKFWSID